MAFALRNPFGFSSVFDDDFGFFSEPGFFRRATPRRASPASPASCGSYGRCYTAPQASRRCCTSSASACCSSPSYASVASAAPSRASHNNASRRYGGGNCRRAPTSSTFLAPASVFQLLNLGSDFERLWDDFEDIYDTAHLLENTKVAAPPAVHSKPVEAAPVAPAAIEAAPSAPSAPSVIPSSAKNLEVAPASTKTVAVPRFGDLDTRTNVEDGSTEFDLHLPGLSAEDVQLDLDLDTHSLTIKAEKKYEEKNSFRHVSVTRTFPIDKAVTSDLVEADFVDGVLHITVAPAPSKAIEAPTAAAAAAASSSAEASTAAPSETVTETPTAVESSTPEATTVVEPSAESSTATSSSEAPGVEVTIAPIATEFSDADSSEVSVEDAEDN